MVSSRSLRLRDDIPSARLLTGGRTSSDFVGHRFMCGGGSFNYLGPVQRGAGADTAPSQASLSALYVVLLPPYVHRLLSRNGKCRTGRNYVIIYTMMIIRISRVVSHLVT
jgi:hypothetical protein